MAALRIEEARALYGIQFADRLPNFDAQGTGTRQRTVGTTGGMVTQGTYTVGLGISAFELDFFGRVKSLTDAALADYLATEEAQRAAYIKPRFRGCKNLFDRTCPGEADRTGEKFLRIVQAHLWTDAKTL